MNLEMLELMVESFAEINRTNDQVFELHKAEDLDLLTVRKSFNNEFVEIEENFDENVEWVSCSEGSIKGLSNEEFKSFLKDNSEEIIELYHQLEDQFKMINHEEIIACVLRDYVRTVSRDELKEYDVIYLDVNIESIAEYLSNRRLKDIEISLTFNDYVGGFDILYSDGMYYLAQ
mgnify:CR=1 FL=1